jgi:hypothetical protein
MTGRRAPASHTASLITPRVAYSTGVVAPGPRLLGVRKVRRRGRQLLPEVRREAGHRGHIGDHPDGAAFAIALRPVAVPRRSDPLDGRPVPTRPLSVPVPLRTTPRPVALRADDAGEGGRHRGRHHAAHGRQPHLDDGDRLPPVVVAGGPRGHAGRGRLRGVHRGRGLRVQAVVPPARPPRAVLPGLYRHHVDEHRRGDGLARPALRLDLAGPHADGVPGDASGQVVADGPGNHGPWPALRRGGHDVRPWGAIALRPVALPPGGVPPRASPLWMALPQALVDAAHARHRRRRAPPRGRSQ